MAQIPFRQRLPYFLAIATCALSALGVGRLLANAGEVFVLQLHGHALPALSRFAFWLSTGLPIRSVGATTAIVIASAGFLIVHKLAPERAAGRVLVLVTIGWVVQVAVLMLTLIGFALPFAKL